ncbi:MULTISPECIES: hypothetical protein [Bacillus]|uniref:hypothetical protein n=1 Tax=Bacillus TaxID=1386 RepID=UPI0022829366|nr:MULTISPECIES: hypothetical protein [Bacillus]MCY8539476.1 hypothetical protein [Bacillus haynesii]MCY8565665.1 hypothetical protein [Bacillus sonorensis]MCY9225991.1 hypothetical protein [Bacillus haynesii]
MKIKLDKDYMVNELGLPNSALFDEITGSSRWSIHHKIVFPYQGRFFETNFSEGATELQDECPWEYEEQVECYEVELKEVKVKKWVRK